MLDKVIEFYHPLQSSEGKLHILCYFCSSYSEVHFFVMIRYSLFSVFCYSEVKRKTNNRRGTNS